MSFSIRWRISSRIARTASVVKTLGWLPARSMPNGERWEIHTVLENSETFSAVSGANASCCGTETLELASTATACC